MSHPDGVAARCTRAGGGRGAGGGEFAQGSFALQNNIRLVPGNHDTIGPEPHESILEVGTGLG
jgi:hypothetical protein